MPDTMPVPEGPPSLDAREVLSPEDVAELQLQAAGSVLEIPAFRHGALPQHMVATWGLALTMRLQLAAGGRSLTVPAVAPAAPYTPPGPPSETVELVEHLAETARLIAGDADPCQLLMDAAAIARTRHVRALRLGRSAG